MAKRRIPAWMIAGGTLIGAWAIYSAMLTDHDMPIGSAIDAERDEFHGKNSALLSYYANTKAEGRPLVLLHSINAAANAYEVRPLFLHYQNQRPVYALDLPGFGFSERSNREYSVELYVAAITDFLKDIVGEPADVIAMSLSSEFAAIAAQQSPDLFHSLTLISPTGLSSTQTQIQENENLYQLLSNPIWSQAVYDLLVSKPGLRYFLNMSFDGNVDEHLLDYHHRSSHQPGARYAPLKFVSGALFTANIFEATYKQLSVPTMVLYDTDPNVNFDRLPDILNSNTNWRARRILNTRGLPHFERLDMIVSALDAFWSEVV